MRELTITETEQVGGGFFILASLLATKAFVIGSATAGALALVGSALSHNNNNGNQGGGKYPYPIYPDTRPYFS